MQRFFRLFHVAILREKRAILRIFGVFLLAFSGFLTARELTENVTKAVSKELQPFFWNDVTVVKNEYVPGSELGTIVSKAQPFAEKSLERYDFNVTLFDHSGNTSLVTVVAFSGSYPLYGNFSITDGPVPDGDLMVSESVRTQFMSGNVLALGGVEIPVGKIITESSETSFSFWNEGHLIVVPYKALSGSELLSKEARVTSAASFKTKNSEDAEKLYQSLRRDPSLEQFRVRSFERNSDRTLDTVEDLSRYVLLVLVSWALFAGIVLLNANAAFLDSVSKNFAVLELLWLPKREKWTLLAVTYSAVIVGAFVFSLPLAYSAVRFAGSFEGAEEFEFLWGPVGFAAGIGIAITVATIPAGVWKFVRRGPMESVRKENGFSRDGWTVPTFFGTGGLFLWLLIILENFLTAAIWTIVVFAFATVLPRLAECGFERLFRLAWNLRKNRFFRFDGMRTIVRPFVPSGLIALCTVSAFSAFLAFLLVSSTFRERLELSSKDDVRIYVLNILEKDRGAVETEFPDLKLFSIIRGRILAVNGEPLAEYLIRTRKAENPGNVRGSGNGGGTGQSEPPRQFSREFSITTTPLSDSKILSGEESLGAKEVSVDEAFANQLGVWIGDRIRFSIAGKEFELLVKNLRESKREGFRPFFFFQVDPTAFSNAPKTYFAASAEEDVQSFKKRLVSVTGEHVTFVDVTAILAIVATVSEKIFAVVWLFLAFVGIFAFLAILTLFSTLTPILQTKAFIYRLFGATASEIRDSAITSVSVLLTFGIVLSAIVGTGAFFLTLERFSFLKFSWEAFGVGAGSFAFAWLILSVVVLGRISRIVRQ